MYSRYVRSRSCGRLADARTSRKGSGGRESLHGYPLEGTQKELAYTDALPLGVWHAVAEFYTHGREEATGVFCGLVSERSAKRAAMDREASARKLREFSGGLQGFFKKYSGGLKNYGTNPPNIF